MIIIIVVACLGDLQLYNICITFTNIYRVKLEIACVRMSFENIYIYICICCLYVSMSLRWFFFFCISLLLVSTYCKEGTFLMHFLTGILCYPLSRSLSASNYLWFSFANGLGVGLVCVQL